MNAQEVLTELAKLGVSLRLRGDDQIEVRGAKAGLPPELMAPLRLHKAELIAQLQCEKNVVAASLALPTITPDPARWYEPFALMDLQESFLIGESEGMPYHVRPHCYLEFAFEQLDVSRFERVLNELLQWQGANLAVITPELQLQVPRRIEPMRLSVHDLRGLTLLAQTQALTQLRERISRQVSPIDRWPWIDCGVVLHGNTQARFYWNNNNIHMDGYSGIQFLTQVFERYAQPDAPMPAALTLGLRDAVLAIKNLEDTAQGQASKDYWLARVPHLPLAPSLPLRPGFNPLQRAQLTRRNHQMPAALWASFKKIAQSQGLTAGNVVFAAYAQVVSHWSGSRHFLFNNMVTHRFPMHPQIMQIIGCFSSLYPLEVDWRGQRPFAERARQLQAQVITDMQHLYWSGVKVLQALNQAQHLPGRAVCPLVVSNGLFMPPFAVPSFSNLETAQTLLDYEFWELKNGDFWFVLDVMEAAFPAGMIDDMWATLIGLMTTLARDAQAWQQAEFDLLPAAQRQERVLVNTTTQPVPSGLLHSGFLQSVRRHGARTALIDAQGALSYGQLGQCVDALVVQLQQAGLQPGERVPVMLAKGREQVVAVLAVLQAGGVYVPIDPGWPGARVDGILQSIEAQRILVGQGGWSQGSVPAMVVDAAVHLPSTGLLSVSLQSPSELAYIIFTSGSTGTPKGVMVSHEAALNTVVDINQRLALTEQDALLGLSALHFDLSVYDIFGVFLAGAALVLPAPQQLHRPDAWLELMHRHGVTVWNSVPALMQLLVEAAPTGLPQLRAVLLSGDWIPVTLPAQIKQTAPAAQVISLGGATEGSIWSIIYPITEPLDPHASSVPYGYPLANQRWHVLLENGQDAPTWVAGDLYIAGTGLALGYWQDQAKTDAAFVRHPRTGERLYKTGDLGRYLPGGCLEFLGRSDFQVKLNGYRVELGEIEQVLLRADEVSAAVAIVSAEQQLHAFVVAPPDWDQAALMALARTHLPSYMVPQVLHRLAQLPLTANGKLDRPALQAACQAAMTVAEAHSHVAPRSDVECSLAHIWSEVLGVSDLSIHDDFFALGGQSFAGVRMMTRIAAQLKQTLPLSALLEGRTIAKLAEQLALNKTWSPLVTLRAQGEGRPCFFVHPAGGNVLCYRALAEQLGRPFYGLQAPGLHGEQAALNQVSAMAALYIKALQTVQPQGPYTLGGWSSGGVIAFEIAHQLEQAGHAVEQVITIDSPAPLQPTPIDSATLALWFLEDLNIGYAPGCVQTSELVGQAQPLARALQLAQARTALTAQVELTQLAPIFEVFQGIINATRSYRLPPAIAASMLIMRARDNHVSEFADHPAGASLDWGWRPYTRGQVHSHVVNGNHYTMLTEPHLGQVARLISSLGSAGANPLFGLERALNT